MHSPIRARTAAAAAAAEWAAKMSAAKGHADVKSLTKDIAEVEARIAELEASYLADTREAGNVVRGWGANKTAKGDERVFSLSSRTSPVMAKKP